MKKSFKSFSICLIIMAMMCTTTYAAAPKDTADPQANSYIFKTTVGIAALGGGKIEVDFSVTANGRKMADIGATWVGIYKADGTRVAEIWYTDPGYEYMIGHNRVSQTASVFYQGVSGQRYYAIVSFYAGEMGVAGGGDYHISTIITA